MLPFNTVTSVRWEKNLIAQIKNLADSIRKTNQIRHTW